MGLAKVGHPTISHKPNKTDAGNGSYGICRVSNVHPSPSPDPRRSAKNNSQPDFQVDRNVKLTKEQTEYLNDSIGDAGAIVARCLELLISHGYIAKSAWTDPRLTSTSAQHCLQITVGEGHHFGYGENQSLAAIDSCSRLWYHLITLPKAPDPTEKEIELKASGRLFRAIISYVERTGESTRVAQLRLRGRATIFE